MSAHTTTCIYSSVNPFNEAICFKAAQAQTFRFSILTFRFVLCALSRPFLHYISVNLEVETSHIYVYFLRAVTLCQVFVLDVN